MVLNFAQAPRDFWAGLLYLLTGAAAIFIARDYDMGILLRMGPGYVPTVLGYGLCLVGVLAIVRSFIKHGEHVSRVAWRALALVVAGVVLFGILARGAGLVPAVLLLVVITAFASRLSRPLPVVLLAGGAAAFSVLLFVKGLGIPLQAFGAWFGY